MLDVRPYGVNKVCGKQQITNVIQRAEAENDVIDGADARQSAQIKQRLARRKHLSDNIEGRHGDYKQSPDRYQEDGEQRRNAERIDRG